MLWLKMSNYRKEMCALIIFYIYVYIPIYMHILVGYKARHETMPVLEMIFNMS